MPTPATQNIALYQGDTWKQTMHVYGRNMDGSQGDPVDLTGATPTAQIRATESSPIAIDITCALTDQGTDPGGIDMSLTAEETTQAVKGKWDLQLEWSNGDIQTLVKGSVTVTAEVTRVG